MAASASTSAPDEFTGVAPISVSKARAQFPPTFVPGIGTLCIEASDDGQGSIDCNGGDTGADLLLAQDHNIDDTDFVCNTGCRENMSCVGMLQGTHQSLCPRCDQGTGMCNAGAASGQVCDPDSNCPNFGICNDGFCPIIDGAGGGPCVDPDIPCQVGLSCTNDKESTCNGRPLSAAVGNYVAGGARVSIPVKISVSLDPGPDDVFCSGDAGELYSNLKNLDAVLRLTTGTTSAMISDANNTPLATITGTTAGSPFSCAALRAGDLAGVTLVGDVTTLDATVLPGLRDLLLQFHLEAKPGILGSCSPPRSTTRTDDTNARNGVETSHQRALRRRGAGPVRTTACSATARDLRPDARLLPARRPSGDDTNVARLTASTITGRVFTPVAGSCDDGNPARPVTPVPPAPAADADQVPTPDAYSGVETRHRDRRMLRPASRSCATTGTRARTTVRRDRLREHEQHAPCDDNDPVRTTTCA
jgi:hypothetical protein